MKALIKRRGIDYRLFDIQIDTHLMTGLAKYELTDVHVVLDHLPFEGKHIPLLDLIQAYTALELRKTAENIEKNIPKR